uniref:penicillin-binding protein 1A n=1 Tax=Thaumasiovibrio occultus TaxID=1891184 RepID=UPI000B34ADA7|nr:PBP1A family penicillin-binding protein [Thaumasiovibrio occultus]
MKFIKLLLAFALICIILGVTTIFGAYLYVKPDLPDVATLRDVELQTPMHVYTSDGKLLQQFAKTRRIPVKLEDIPKPLIDAVLATEDARYYEHYGIDPIGITRAFVVWVSTGQPKQGASTITQQLARNFFLSNEKTIVRKVKEIFIALHIEQLLTKEEILELYLNKIFLGQNSYGVAAASQVYYGKELSELTLGEMALIAGLPKAPSSLNPIASVERATARRNVVLGRMLEVGFISQFEYDQARAEPVVAKRHYVKPEVNAGYMAEIARAWAVEQYGEDKAYNSGYRIYTTADSKLQEAANDAAIGNLLAYDQRHGYRGPIAKLWEGESALSHDEILEKLKVYSAYYKLVPAVVTQVEGKTAQIITREGDAGTIDWDGMKWARPFISDTRQGNAPKAASDVFSNGDVIYAVKQEENWSLSQVPEANTAFAAISPFDGAVVALVGGFDYSHSKFNRATMSIRQVGSSIKPFIYAAAVERGMTLATLINDAPFNHWDESMGTAWRPKNSPERYEGPLRTRVGLAQSKNVMAVRILQRVGLAETLDYLPRFGFKRDDLPYAEAIALGAGNLTPLEMAQGFAVFANDGYYVKPYFIERVEDKDGNVIFQAEPKTVCQENCPPPELTFNKDQFAQEEPAEEAVGAEETTTETDDGAVVEENLLTEETPEDDSPYTQQVMTREATFIMREMLESNIWGDREWLGTGWRGRALGRHDIGGKTGTTNESKDTWYVGYGPGIVASVWVGFDNHSRSLGRTSRNPNMGDRQIVGGSAGGNIAQPAWVDFMKVALADVPEQRKVVPNNIVRVRINRNTGLLTTRSDRNSMYEYFVKGTEPTEYHVQRQSIFDTEEGEEAPEELF